MKELYYFFADATRIALRSIFAQKLRAFLTLIGIIFGVASVVVVGASISGFNSYIVSTVSKSLVLTIRSRGLPIRANGAKKSGIAPGRETKRSVLTTTNGCSPTAPAALKSGRT